MFENFNYELFNFINATPRSPKWIIIFARFIAQDLISVVPILMVYFWLWGPKAQIHTQRQLVIKILIATTISLLVSRLLSHIFPYSRPFVDHVGYNFLPHIADDSFPSNHGAVTFTFALVFLFLYRVWFGIILMCVSMTIAWSRIYLGVHWPLDMVGSFLVGFISLLSSQILWGFYGIALYFWLQQIYHLLFAPFIRKGWIRE